jgi:YD repeat-containing protein
MILSIGPGVYLNTAFLESPGNVPGFRDPWYGHGISAGWDVQASGIDQKNKALVPLKPGIPIAVNFGGTIKTYQPFPGDAGASLGYQSMWHDDSKISFDTLDAGGPQTLRITLADGKNLVFDANGWLTKSCADPACTYPLEVFTRDPVSQQLSSVADYTQGVIRTTTILWDKTSKMYAGIVDPAGATWAYKYVSQDDPNVDFGPAYGFTVTITFPPVNGTAPKPLTYVYKSPGNGVTPKLIITDTAGAQTSFWFWGNGDPYVYSPPDTREGWQMNTYLDEHVYTDHYNDSFRISACPCTGQLSLPFTPPDGGEDGGVCNTTRLTDTAGFVHTTEFTADGKIVSQNDALSVGSDGGGAKEAFRVTAWSPLTKEWPQTIQIENFKDPQQITVDETHQGRPVTVETPTHVQTNVTSFANDGKWFAYNQPETWTVSGYTIKAIDNSTVGKVSTDYSRISVLSGTTITTTADTSDCMGCTETTTIKIPSPTQGIFLDEKNNSAEMLASCTPDGTSCTSQTASQDVMTETYNIEGQKTGVQLPGLNVDTTIAYFGLGQPPSTMADKNLNLSVSFNMDPSTLRPMGGSVSNGGTRVDETSLTYDSFDPDLPLTTVVNNQVMSEDIPAENNVLQAVHPLTK